MLLFYSESAKGSGAGEHGSDSRRFDSAESDTGDQDASEKVNGIMDRLFIERGYKIYEGVPDLAPVKKFSLRGCSIMSSTEKTLKLANSEVQTCELSFGTHKQMKAWKEAIESCVKVMEVTGKLAS